MQADAFLALKLPQGYFFSDLKLRHSVDETIDPNMDLLNPGPMVTGIQNVWYEKLTGSRSSARLADGITQVARTSTELNSHTTHRAVA